jgi:hypothetical protein
MACTAALITPCTASESELFATTLERSGYTRLTSSSDIVLFLDELSKNNASAAKTTIGPSALGLPISALLISTESEFLETGRSSAPGKLNALLVGSQHGTEPSGAEALLLLTRDILAGNLQSYLADFNFIVVPDGNPDGRSLKRRVNGNGVNISTNYVTLSEPESRGIIEALHRCKPDVVLDVHESAVLKKKSLGKQGYLIDFEAQFEAANNPNVSGLIRSYSYERLLPEIIALVKKRGLPAQRYIGEITDIDQTITHGGLSLRNLRNMAGLLGAFSFLLENRLADKNRPFISLPLRKRETNRLEQRRFRYKGRVIFDIPLGLPQAYIVSANKHVFGTLFDRHHFEYSVAKEPEQIQVENQYIEIQNGLENLSNGNCPTYKIFRQRQKYTIQTGDLIVGLNQPARRLIALILELRSMGGIFTVPEYCQTILNRSNHYIFRANKTQP